MYYFTIVDTPHIFTASSQDYPKLPLAEKGDAVDMKYLDSGESILPVTAFDDTSIVTDRTLAEDQVQGAGEKRQENEVKRDLSADTKAQIDALSPEQQRELLKKLKQQ